MNSGNKNTLLVDVLDYNMCSFSNLDFLQNCPSIINPLLLLDKSSTEDNQSIEIIGYTENNLDKYLNYSFVSCGNGNYSLGKPDRFDWYDWYVGINNKLQKVPYQKCKHLGLSDYFSLEDIVIFLSMEWAKRRSMNLSKMFSEEEIRNNTGWRRLLNRVKFCTPDLKMIPNEHRGIILSD